MQITCRPHKIIFYDPKNYVYKMLSYNYVHVFLYLQIFDMSQNFFIFLLASTVISFIDLFKKRFAQVMMSDKIGRASCRARV